LPRPNEPDNASRPDTQCARTNPSRREIRTNPSLGAAERT
jgi:hypothetical protein